MLKLLKTFLLVLACWLTAAATVQAQGMPVDSIAGRLRDAFHTDAALRDIRSAVPNFASQRVWGLSVGDFTNDSLADLGISLYDVSLKKNQVRIVFFQNSGSGLRKMFERVVPYVESPIEVGLTTEGSVVTIVRKLGEDHWYQEGYTIEFGDVILVDKFETTKQELRADAKSKSRSLGHELYRNFENLNTRESYFSATTEEPLLATKYVTFPAYQRLREVYPGFGREFFDTSMLYVLSGSTFRKNAEDISIKRAVAAHEQEYIYFSITVNDEKVIRTPNGTGDRVALWFDTKLKGDRRILSTKGGFPVFRTSVDSFVYGLTFDLPQEPGPVTSVNYTSLAQLNSPQQEALRNIRARYIPDTNAAGLITGYSLLARIPILFFGFESNPAGMYDQVVPQVTRRSDSLAEVMMAQKSDESEEAAAIGFTAVVYDIDDPMHPNEVTVQATSLFKQTDPTTYGTMLLYPSSRFYGQVLSPYLPELTQHLREMGY